MSYTELAHWLVAYDISDDRQLGRVHRRLKREGIPIQYSLFYLRKSHQQMVVLMNQLDRLVTPESARIKAYHLPQVIWKVEMGLSMLPEDLLLANDPHDWYAQKQVAKTSKSPSPPLASDCNNWIF